MHPRKEDEYRWSVLPQKEYLFEKNLSKLSTGVYTQIIQGIGVFFEALPNDSVPVEITNDRPTELLKGSTTSHQSTKDGSTADVSRPVEEELPEANFMAHITQLQNEVAFLRTEARQWQSSAEVETRQRVKLEGELEKAKSAFRELRKESIELKSDCEKARRQCHHLKTKEDALNGDVRQLMAVAHRLAAVSRVTPFILPQHRPTSHLGRDIGSEP